MNRLGIECVMAEIRWQASELSAVQQPEVMVEQLKLLLTTANSLVNAIEKDQQQGNSYDN